MTIDVRELAQKIDEGFAQSLAGEEVVIVDGDTPKVKLVPVANPALMDEPVRKKRVAGIHQGLIETTPDFDAPLGDAFWEGRE
jgi:antitoxin (DNA-binding transcriptional repressor) of toxin-antitoxin stability system